MLHFLMLFGLTALCGGLAFAPKAQAQEKQNNNIVERQPSPKRVSYNDNDSEITLSVNEVNGYTFDNFAQYLIDTNNAFENSNFQSTSIIYGSSDEYTYDDFLSENDIISLSYILSDNYYIYFKTDNNKFSLDINNTPVAFDNEITLVLNFTIYESVKNAIELDIQANSAGDDMPQVLTDFVTILVSGINSLATGIAGGIVTMAKALFLEVNATTGAVTGLSVFGGLVAIFAGLALAIAITTKVYLWVTSLGN